MKTKLLFILTMCGALTLFQAFPAVAHHSTAPFDTKQEVTVNGTVKSWQFVNPHSWLQVGAIDADGNEVLWSLEALGRRGDLKKDTFKAGEKIQVTFNPMKNGRPAGLLLEAISEDGRKWEFILRNIGKKPPAKPQ